MSDITIVPQDYITIHTKTDTVMKKFYDGCEVYEVKKDRKPLVRCRDCKHRYGDECPMRYVEWVTYDDDGYIEWDDIVHDHTMDDGFCNCGEREDGEA